VTFREGYGALKIIIFLKENFNMTTPDANNIFENKKHIDSLIATNINEESNKDEPKLTKTDLDEQQSDEPESGEAELTKTDAKDAPEEKSTEGISDDSSLADITLSVLSDNGKSIDDIKLENKVISLVNDLQGKQIGVFFDFH
jgi:hypothetical protein